MLRSTKNTTEIDPFVDSIDHFVESRIIALALLGCVRLGSNKLTFDEVIISNAKGNFTSSTFWPPCQHNDVVSLILTESHVEI
jgi:hypothetical protein